MNVRSAEDVLRLIAADLKGRGRPVSEGEPVDLLALIGYPVPDDIQRWIDAAWGYEWIKRVGTRSPSCYLTHTGLKKYFEVEEDAGLGGFERLLSREKRLRPLTWGFWVQALTLLLAVSAIVISIIALVRSG